MWENQVKVENDVQKLKKNGATVFGFQLSWKPAASGDHHKVKSVKPRLLMAMEAV
jgi:hypothetical protein